MSRFQVFWSDDESDTKETAEEINELLGQMYLASDSEFIVMKDEKFYCKGKVDKENGWDIASMSKEDKNER